MEKHEKMVALVKENSRKKMELALREIRKMYRAKEKITVAELVRRTELSRTFFYNNKEVHDVLQECRNKQANMVTRNPKQEAMQRVMLMRIKQLELQLEQSVPKKEFDDLKKKYEKSKKNGLIRAYDAL